MDLLGFMERLRFVRVNCEMDVVCPRLDRARAFNLDCAPLPCLFTLNKALAIHDEKALLH